MHISANAPVCLTNWFFIVYIQFKAFRKMDTICICAKYPINGLKYAPAVHGDVIKLKHFPPYWPFVRGIHRWLVNSPHKGQWRGALIFFFLSTRWINGWVNNREAGDLRCQRAHYHVIVMYTKDYYWWLISLIHISVSRHDFYLIMKYGIQVWRVKNNCRYAPIGIQKSLAPIKCIYF